MTEFSGWNDMGMKWGDADIVRLNPIWMTLEMFRQAILERCEKIYAAIYRAYMGDEPGADDWKEMLYEQEKMLSEIPRLPNVKTYAELLNSQLNQMMISYGREGWGCFTGPGSYIDFNDGQATSVNSRWEEPADGGTFHVEQLKTTYGYYWDVDLPTPVLVSLDASLNGKILSVTDVRVGTHSYGAPSGFTVKTAMMNRNILIARTDPDNIDWYAQLAKGNSDALRNWVNQFYHMLNLLNMPSVSGGIGYGTTVGMDGSTEDDYQENVRSASVDCWGSYSWAYWSGMTEEDWDNSEGLTLSEAWSRSKWTGQNGCAYANHPEKSYYEENDPSMGYWESAVRRRQWFKLVKGNNGGFLNIDGNVRAKQEMYLVKYGGGSYLNELGAENSWVTLCDMLVPTGDDKSARIASGNIDGMPGTGGWEAELRKITVTAEIDLGSILDLKFQPET